MICGIRGESHKNLCYLFLNFDRWLLRCERIYHILTRCLEKWKIYRDSIESIKRLLVLYWVDQIDDQNLKTLVNDLEALKGKEYERWSSTYNAIAKTSVSRGKSEENSAGKDSGTSSK